MFSLVLEFCCSEVLLVDGTREYFCLSVCLSILTFTSVFPYLSLLKIMSSPLYLRFQSNTTKFILIFSLCIFVTPFSSSEKPGSHITRSVALYVTNLPLLLQSPMGILSLFYTVSDIPSWSAVTPEHASSPRSCGHPPQLPCASTIRSNPHHCANLPCFSWTLTLPVRYVFVL